MSPVSHRRQAQRFHSRNVAPALELLSRFTAEVLADLAERAQYLPEPDGFPSTSVASGRSVGRSSELTSSVEAALIRREAGFMADPIGDAGRRLFGALVEVRRLTARAQILLELIQGAGPP